MSQITSAVPPTGGYPDDPFVGTRYRACAKLASGSVGDLYAVEHVDLGKRFAAKLLREEFGRDARVIDRLRLEAQSLGNLRHPNIVGITGLERTGSGLPFIVMELLRGRTLEDELTANGALPLEQALEWADQILFALQAVHDLGVIHRDVQPKNIFLHESTTGKRTLKLLDFGTARVLEGHSERTPAPLAFPTNTGVLIIPARFNSPEGARGLPIDARTDLYQVGLVLYRMITGREPFEVEEAGPKSAGTALLVAHATEIPRPPSTFAKRDIPLELDCVILCALSKCPEERFRTAAEFRGALANIHKRQYPEHATRKNPTGGRPSLRLRALLFLVLAALAAGFVIGLNALFLLGGR